MSLGFRRCLLGTVMLPILLALSGPCSAWLFDAGEPHNLGAMLKDNSTLVWAAAPFKIAQDSYATKFGAPAMRAYGPEGSGFTVYLAQDLYDVVGSALAVGMITPTSAIREYYYFDLETPVFLAADEFYLLVFAPNDPGFYGGISYTLTGYYAEGTADYGESWYALPYPLCIRVGGYVVPEPASFSVLAFALLGIPALMKKRAGRTVIRNI